MSTASDAAAPRLWSARRMRRLLRFYPPLTVQPEEISRCLAALDAALTEVARLPTALLRAANVATSIQHWIPKPLLVGFRWALT